MNAFLETPENFAARVDPVESYVIPDSRPRTIPEQLVYLKELSRYVTKCYRRSALYYEKAENCRVDKTMYNHWLDLANHFGKKGDEYKAHIKPRLDILMQRLA